MKTTLAKAETTTHDWKIVDATDQILGRLAVQIANALRGRNKPTYPRMLILEILSSLRMPIKSN